MTHRLRYSDVTPRADFINRRKLMAGAAAMGAIGSIGGSAFAKALSFRKTDYTVPKTIAITKASDVASYNNFYEFGTDKSDPAQYADQMTIDPWSVEIGGMVDKPGRYDLADILSGIALEERIYRFRCVEAWSMVVPWVGFSLSELLNKFEPQSGAKYVAFETLLRPKEMPGVQWNKRFPWPYV